jgi:hypothetical protein
MKGCRLFILAFVLPLAGQAQEVPRDKWLEVMTVTIPTYFCQPEQYFRQCFDVSAEECEQVALSGTRTCISKLQQQIPEMLQHPADSKAWGTRLGTCAGVAYEGTLADKHKSDPKCQNAMNWRGG